MQRKELLPSMDLSLKFDAAQPIESMWVADGSLEVISEGMNMKSEFREAFRDRIGDQDRLERKDCGSLR